jgi:hypothetical protein
VRKIQFAFGLIPANMQRGRNQYTIKAVSNFDRDNRSSRCTIGVVDTGGNWKKSSIVKVLIILFGHLWEVELSYRYIFAFGVVDTGGAP